MFKLIKPLSVVITIGALSACASAPQSVDGKVKKFGNANHSNVAAHAITPDPELKANTYIPADRDRVRAAREAYRKGEVKPLEQISSVSE